MKTIRAYGHGFLLRRGLLNIGRNYKTGNWAIGSIGLVGCEY